jgi:hypothetical protein
MQDKYTPGPWEAMGSLVRSPMHQPEGLPRGVQIVECRDGYFLPHTEEAKANARLIAAAPELAVALRRLLSEYIFTRTMDGTSAEDCETMECVSVARAALAKATGSAQ